MPQKRLTTQMLERLTSPAKVNRPGIAGGLLV